MQDPGDAGLIPWSRRWQPTPVFLLGKSMDRAWRATVHAVVKELDRTLTNLAI